VKGCVRALLFQLFGYLAVSGAVAFLLKNRWGFPPARILGVSLGAGFLAWLAMSFLVGVARLAREMSALHHNLSGKRPTDGKRAVIAGTIDASGLKLRSPLSGTDCVAFKYAIFRTISVRRRHRRLYYEGIGLTPSVITTNAGTFRLLAVPAFEGEEGVETETSLRNWAEHVATAPFESEPSRRILEKQWTDDDGAYRCEIRHPAAGEIPLAECGFRESLIRPGDKVYAVGLYSESRGGLVPDLSGAKESRIVKGDPDAIRRLLKQRMVWLLIGGVAFCAAAAAVLWAFVAHAGASGA
jgi:hypothetical protein